jgi:hypothetical protein
VLTATERAAIREAARAAHEDPGYWVRKVEIESETARRTCLITGMCVGCADDIPAEQLGRSIVCGRCALDALGWVLARVGREMQRTEDALDDARRVEDGAIEEDEAT